MRADGSTRLLRPEGYAIGLFPRAEAAVEEVRLAKGDRVAAVLRRPGRRHDRAGERFGSRASPISRSSYRATSLREMVEAVDAAVLAFRGGAAFDDDVSLLVVERT